MATEVYFLIRKNEDGTAGQPVANEDDAIMAFTSIEKAKGVREMFKEPLVLYKGEIYLSMEVVES